MIHKDNSTEKHEPSGREKVLRGGFGSDSGRSGDAGSVNAEHYALAASYTERLEAIKKLVSANPELAKRIDLGSLSGDPTKLSSSELAGMISKIAELEQKVRADNDDADPNKSSLMGSIVRFVGNIGSKLFGSRRDENRADGFEKAINESLLGELGYLKPLNTGAVDITRYKNGQPIENIVRLG
jgi:hypothetical protein